MDLHVPTNALRELTHRPFKAIQASQKIPNIMGQRITRRGRSDAAGLTVEQTHVIMSFQIL